MIGWKWYLAGIKRKYERRKTHLFAMKRPIWRSRIPTITVVGDLAVIVHWAESCKTSTFPILCFTEINLSIAINRSCRLIKSMIRFCSVMRNRLYWVQAIDFWIVTVLPPLPSLNIQYRKSSAKTIRWDLSMVKLGTIQHFDKYFGIWRPWNFFLWVVFGWVGWNGSACRGHYFCFRNWERRRAKRNKELGTQWPCLKYIAFQATFT